MQPFTVADRIRDVQSPVIPIVGELVRANPGTISLGQGVVHYPPPPEALERIRAAAADPSTHGYGHVAGIPPLLDVLSRKLSEENGIRIGDDCEVVVTAGGNMAFLIAILAIADPGDEIILPSPYYFNHEMAVRIAGCRPVLVDTDAAYQLRLDALEAAVTDRTRAIVTVSPNNPTGAVYPSDALASVNGLCRRRRLFHISDEAYEYFIYDDAVHTSPGSFETASTCTISLYSFSKAFGLAGWRMGYMVVPHALMDAVRKIQDTMLICPPLPSQYAALGAMEAGASYCKRHVRDLAGVRRLVVDELRMLGQRVTVAEARGAFYVLMRIDADLNDLAVVRRLIEEFGVAVIPGSAFGAVGGCYLRVAYGALEKETVRTAMKRLALGMRTILGL